MCTGKPRTCAVRRSGSAVRSTRTGTRWRSVCGDDLRTGLSWDGAVGYTDIADEGQVSLGLAARWFFKDHVALGIQGSFGEDETSYGAGLRWDWGRSHRTHGGAHADTAVAPAAAAASSSTAPSLAQMCDMSSKVDQAECLGQIALGMSKDEVANALGRPSSTAADGSVLKYGDRYLKFDDKNRLTSITEQMPE